MFRKASGVACLVAAMALSPAALALGTLNPPGSAPLHSATAPPASMTRPSAGLSQPRPAGPALGKRGAIGAGPGSGQIGGCAALYPRPAGC